MVIICSLIPVVFWYFAVPLKFRFLNLSATLTSLGQITGLVGMAMFALTFILSSRIGGLEDYFGGMNKAYVAHHIFGGVSFILLLIHPLLLAGSYIPLSLKSAADMLLPSTNWQVNLGITALLFMMSMLIFTFFVNLPYEVWRFTHKFLGVAFFFGGLHAFFIPSDMSRYLYVRIYMLTLIGIGLAGYLYRTVLGRFLVKRYTYIVKKVNQLNPQTLDVVMAPQKKPLHFAPGQFVYISFKKRKLQETHPFSILSPPENSDMALGLKTVGDFTNEMKNLKPGTLVRVEGPFGRFTYSLFNNYQQIWIAGGIGITPFISMAKSISDLKYKINFYILARDVEEMVYLRDAVLSEARFPNLNVIPHYSSLNGRLTATLIQEKSGLLLDKDIFMCGPPPMMYALKKQFRALGLKSSHIHSEEFQML